MIERKDGSIIIVSSIGGLKGSTVLGAYAISKAADMQLARNLACEYGKHNIRVNCIAPGLIKTDFAKALWDNPETLKASTARSPLLRIGIPDEIAGAAVFLGSGAPATSYRPDHRDRRRRDDQLTARAASLHRRVDQVPQQVRVYSRWPGPCIMNTANRSSFGSIQKNVPAMPLQKNWPSEPGNGAMPCWVRTAKPRPKPWPAGISVPSILTRDRDGRTPSVAASCGR